MASEAGHYRLIGGIGSPYSMKMRALMRYRRIPHVWVPRTPAVHEELAHVKPQIIPVLQYPDDGSYHVDSTPMIFELERRHADGRSVVPDDPGHAFLALLIEDMADEWGTKCMFDYRWARERDQDYCSSWLAREVMGSIGDAQVEAAAERFRERQVGRMPIVGCTDENRPIIEETYHRVCRIFDDMLHHRDYLLGTRPSMADFGWYGQLSQLGRDPTPADIMRESYPRTFQWLDRIDDASGLEGHWLDAEEPLPRPVVAMLILAGEAYLPFLAANHDAIENGEDRVSITIFGKPYEQATFRYQAKCFSHLRAELKKLKGASRKRVESVLKETGCWEYLVS